MPPETIKEPAAITSSCDSLDNTANSLYDGSNLSVRRPYDQQLLETLS